MIRTLQLVGRGTRQWTCEAFSLAHPRSIFVGILSPAGFVAAALATAQDTARPLAIDATEQTTAFSRAFAREANSIADSRGDDTGEANGATAVTPRATVGEPAIAATLPNGGENWQAGTTRNTTSNSTSPSGDVVAFLLKNGVWWASIGSAPIASGSLAQDERLRFDI